MIAWLLRLFSRPCAADLTRGQRLCLLALTDHQGAER